MKTTASSINYLQTVLALPMTNRLVSAKEISLRTGKSVPWIYQEEKAQRFPNRIRIGIRGVAWQGSEVQHWLDSHTTLIQN